MKMPGRTFYQHWFGKDFNFLPLQYMYITLYFLTVKEDLSLFFQQSYFDSLFFYLLVYALKNNKYTKKVIVSQIKNNLNKNVKRSRAVPHFFRKDCLSQFRLLKDILLKQIWGT